MRDDKNRKKEKRTESIEVEWNREEKSSKEQNRANTLHPTTFWMHGPRPMFSDIQNENFSHRTLTGRKICVWVWRALFVVRSFVGNVWVYIFPYVCFENVHLGSVSPQTFPCVPSNTCSKHVETFRTTTRKGEINMSTHLSQTHAQCTKPHHTHTKLVTDLPWASENFICQLTFQLVLQ